MAKEENAEVAQDSGSIRGFDRSQFLDQIKSEATKKKREALKGKIGGLMAKREEAVRAVAVIDKEINEEIDKFEQGL